LNKALVLGINTIMQTIIKRKEEGDVSNQSSIYGAQRYKAGGDIKYQNWTTAEQQFTTAWNVVGTEERWLQVGF
jgi:hypothetical protein